VNYAGSDLNSGAPAASADECCAQCEADAACAYWTFCPQCSCPGSESPGCCHPKASKAGATPAPGRVSGQSGTYKPPTPAPPAPPGVKNVLLMIADDLRPQLMAAYGHSWMKTPNIDKFTSTATVFLRAYVQQQVCSPSRNSFMSGRRPDATGVYNLYVMPSLTTPRLAVPLQSPLTPAKLAAGYFIVRISHTADFCLLQQRRFPRSPGHGRSRSDCPGQRRELDHDAAVL
jgi:hypothetical protein